MVGNVGPVSIPVLDFNITVGYKANAINQQFRVLNQPPSDRFFQNFDPDAGNEELRTVVRDEGGEEAVLVVGRSAELRLLDGSRGQVIQTTNIPYGAELHLKNNQKVYCMIFSQRFITSF